MASLATTVVSTVTQTISASSTTATSTNRATAQGGVFEHINPAEYSASNPILLWIIQASIIIIFCRLLHWPLGYLRQPRVIAEVIGGILLGPSVMGRIPGFTAAIFPTVANANLNLIANIGLVLFLFLVGLEVDLRHLWTHWRIALSVSVVSMAVPFGLGAALSWGIYNEFKDEPGTQPVSFGIFLLFVGVAMAITAFPVLCRILVEFKLLHSSVGVIVLAAGVGNDVVGWILLALCVALVNAGAGLAALWILLTCVGFILFMVYAVRPAFIWLLRRNKALEHGPSQGMVALTLVICLLSALFTGAIGVHAIFGAFLAGIIMPHDGGFAIHVTEKIEDLVSAVFLPLYFAYSGLNTNIGLLDSGIIWGYVIAIIIVAFASKFLGAALAARANGMVWRECFTVGSLMSCKGLVELIVLNIGLQAKILSTRTFTMFVIMALVTTCATSPLVAFLYPPWYQTKIEAWKRGEIDWDTSRPTNSDEKGVRRGSFDQISDNRIRKMLVHLRLDTMPAMITFMAMLGGNPKNQRVALHPTRPAGKNTEHDAHSVDQGSRPIAAHGLRLMELSDRGSSVMQVSEVAEYSLIDPLINTFRWIGSMHNFTTSGDVAIVPESRFPDVLASKARSVDADLLLLPWSETGKMSESIPILSAEESDRIASSSYIQFMISVFDQSPTNTAIFINRGFGGVTPIERRPRTSSSATNISEESLVTPVSPIRDQTHHIFCPFFGGQDDQQAVHLTLQMASNAHVTATIVHFEVDENMLNVAPTASASSAHTPVISRSATSAELSALAAAAHTKRAEVTTSSAHTGSTERDTALIQSLKTSIPAELSGRVVFESVRLEDSTNPLIALIERVNQEVHRNPQNAGDLVIVGRNAGRMRDLVSSNGRRKSPEATNCLGVVGTEIVEQGVRASTIIVQATAHNEA